METLAAVRAQVNLYDRVDTADNVLAGTLSFSDGSTVKTGELPDDGRQGLEVRFPARRVNWLVFAVDQVKPGSPNIGLSEIAVFRSPAADSNRKE